MKDKFNKTTLNKIIKWTSSRFNEYTKAEAIDKILRLKYEKPPAAIFLHCGSYGCNAWSGYYYVAKLTPTNKVIIIDKYNNKELAVFQL